MSIVAAPKYLGGNFADASPGMRFGMYLPVWLPDWKKNKNLDWHQICKLGSKDRNLIQSLQDRQQAMALSDAADDVLILPAKSTAPFTTGLGNEHPLENGFSFLWPYGLPYLPGSGVKGVLRQAVRELSSGEWDIESGWDTEQRYKVKNGKLQPLSMADVLFGLESKDGGNEHFRGVLAFWDVIPEISGGRLSVEIMTPHQKHYYQDGQAPHDSGDPVPIPFLTVPPGSGFQFVITCDHARLKRIAPELTEDDQWKALMEKAFEHAFDWLGFGAKTAVGYGAMHLDDQTLDEEKQRLARRREEARKAKELEQLTASLPEDAAWLERQKACGEWKDNGSFLTAIEIFLGERANLSSDAVDILKQELDRRWKGIVKNPDAVKGKKNKPMFKERPKKIVQQILALAPEK